MLLRKSSKTDLALCRILFLVGGGAYFFIWFILKYVEPGAYDPVWGRGIIFVATMIALGLTYVSQFVRNYVIVIAYFLAYTLTFYYVYLLTRNYFSFTYSIGMMTIVFGTAVVFKESYSLLAYLILSIVSVGIGYMFIEYPAVPPQLYLSILTTTSMVAFLSMNIRLNVQKELNVKNNNLKQVYKEMDTQRRLVETKNNDITDSIVYAKKIQFSIIPEKDGLVEHLPDSFIYYKVKDIVSGDFYWYHKKGDELYIAAVDCTGHGVPGALVSMIGITLLKQTIDHQHIVQPGDVLANMQKEIYSFLQRGSSDGMDIGLCAVNQEKKILSYAGAMIRLMMVRDGKVTETKGNRSSISRNISFDAAFTNHTIEYQPGDAFYIFTDGYCDQFGGEKKKKYMFRKFETLLSEIHHLPMKEQKSILASTHKDWKGDLEQVDDILVIGFKL